ncbi:SHOCT-like domain-containing protein, partial [Dysosmobacter welbionis]
SPSSVCGSARWRTPPSAKASSISGTARNMTASMKRHSAARRQTGLSVSTA